MAVNAHCGHAPAGRKLVSWTNEKEVMVLAVNCADNACSMDAA